jgi:predicted O-linked N-acetylglucosamine transferase (SPINDLY family)
LQEAARAALQAGNFAAAVRAYSDLIAFDPTHAEPYYKRGNAHNALAESHAALADYDRAIALDAGYANAHCNRGTVLERLERWEEALASYDRAIALNPTDFLAHYNRAWVFKQLGRLDQALDDYARAIELNPGYFAAHVNRGYVLQDLQRHEPAVQSFDRAIELNAAYADAHRARGSSLVALGRFADALASFDRAIALEPRDAAAHHGRAFVLFCLKDREGAIAGYDQVVALDPDYRFVAGSRLHARALICDWTDAERDTERLSAALRTRRPVCQPFVAMTLIDSPELQRIAAEVWVREMYPPNPALGPLAPRQRAAKIRLGYFSPDFRTHAVAQLIAELFELHDRSRFEVTGFAFGPDAGNDELRRRLQRGFDRFIDVRSRTDLEVAALARELEIDIAVDLAAFTEESRTNIFAMRAAPIQVNFLGYPGTSGAGYMDYLIADRTLIPEAQRTHYSEKILFMPHSYQINDSQRKIAAESISRAALKLPQVGFVFCCFNNNFKIRAETFASWMRILERVPRSVLWLLEDNALAARNLRAAAQRLQVDPERLVFAPRTSPAQHLARQRCADLFLDCLPYNAHTTASEALWAGLPILTLAGESFAARVAASLLRALEMPELVTATRDEYEALAVRLANQPEELRRLRDQLANKRATAPLFDPVRYARSLEAGFVQMVERHDAGLPPADLVAADRSGGHR